MATKTKGLNIRTKLLAMVMLLVTIAIIVGAVSFFGMSQALEQYQTHLLPDLENAHNIDALTAKSRRYEKEFFLFSSLGDNPAYKKKQSGYRDKLLKTYQAITPLLNNFQLDEQDSKEEQVIRAKLVSSVRDAHNSAIKSLLPLTENMMGGKNFLESAELYTVYKTDIHKLEDNVTLLIEHLSTAMQTQRQASITFEEEMITTLLILSIAMVLFGIVAGLFVSNRISNPLKQLMEGIETVGRGEIVEVTTSSKDEFAEIARVFNATINRIKGYIKTDEQRRKTEENVINFLEVVSEAADGDLTLRAPVTEDAFGSIADAYNLMIESLADLLTDTSINAEEVGEESRHLLEIFQKMKEGTDDQLHHVTSATDAAEETAESASQIAEKTNLAQQAATKVDEATALGNERVNRNIEGMQLIRVTVQVINKKMKSLSERLLEIGTISQLISDVATRTTILAMNASIEASRAGEQGRGFLVISDEIKRLADEASDATRQIGGIVKAIQSEANDVTTALEEETSTVEEQTRIAKETGEALSEINLATGESKQVVTEITKLSQEQQQISDSMVATIRNMADITARTSSLVTESAQISEGLNGVSESLLQSLAQFNLNPEKSAAVVSAQAEPVDIVAETFLALDAPETKNTTPPVA